MLQFILGKRRENIWLKIGKQKNGRKKNKQHETPGIGEEG
jgi:hypothetical protein